MKNLWSSGRSYEKVKDWETRHLSHSVFYLFEDIELLNKRIAELEKEASNTNGLWVTSNDLQVWKLEQQASGIEVAVRLNLKSYSDPYVIKLMHRAAELRNQAKALKEQGDAQRR